MVGVNRRSQGMPVNVIIIAVLALIVLVVLTIIFTGRIRIFSSTLESCQAKQGQCETGPFCSSNKALVTGTNCPETAQDKPNKKICCVQVLNP
ncbi:MAG TPA: hypothetical protein VJJ52_05995 [Candidatus Nanoarchaeia archaeon]|nr:hypothetical protein [Candidatus Nanoarchaeia archaeon]